MYGLFISIPKTSYLLCGGGVDLHQPTQVQMLGKALKMEQNDYRILQF